jgi:hypothetical protein
LQYVIGLARNPRLERAVEPPLEKSLKQFEKREERQREFTEFLCQADSWDRSRRMKAEVNSIGINRRFVVSNYQHLSPEQLCDHYTDRGRTENFIKALEKDLPWTAGAVIASWPASSACCWTHWPIRCFYVLRDYLLGTPWQSLEIETLRRRLIKVGARTLGKPPEASGFTWLVPILNRS